MAMAAMSTTMGQQYRFNSFNPMSSFNSFNTQHMNWAPEPMACSKVTDKLVNELQVACPVCMFVPTLNYVIR